MYEASTNRYNEQAVYYTTHKHLEKYFLLPRDNQRCRIRELLYNADVQCTLLKFQFVK